MKIIEQSHEILSISGGLESIEVAGRTCYQSEDRIGCTVPKYAEGPENCPDECIISKPDEAEDGVRIGRWHIDCSQKCPNHSSHKFTKMLMDRGHHAMIEFGDITVRFITNRGVTHELVRHRMCSFARESTRYVKYDGNMEFIKPVWCDEKILGKYPKGPAKDYSEPLKNFISACTNAEYSYKVLMRDGWKPQQAREVLPNSLKTEIIIKANFREWMHILTLRTSKPAHPQIRALMLPLLKELKTKVPVVFDDI